jgi:hypothetical protein
MLLLTATTDKIQVITSAAVTVDVHTSFMDASNANPPVVQGDTMGRLNTAITTATTTDIVVAPAASEIRNVKTINIRNKHASTATDVTVQFNQNATLFELVKVTLLAGQTLEYVEGVGWFVVQSEAKLDKTLLVTSDVDNATTSFADVTGLTCPVESGKHYSFDCRIFHIENASTTGARFAINGPSMTAMRVYGWSVFAGSITAATSNAALADVSAVDTSAVGVTTSSAGTPQVVMAIMSGWINPSAAGTFAVRSQSEVAVAAGVKVKAGSWCRIWESVQG